MSTLLLAPVIAIAVLLGVAMLLAAQQGRQKHLVGKVVDRASHAGRPSVLFFTGATCHICHTAQKPALQTLAGVVGDGAEIREVDVAVEPDLARIYKVMTLPTTIVLSADGQVLNINVGFASAETLREQLNRVRLHAAA